VSEKLKQTFGTARTNGDVRLLKCSIVNDEVVSVASEKVSGTYEQDFNLIPKHFVGGECCFILFRLDSKSNHGIDWVLMCYVPDNGKVRDKMVYASTRALMKQQLGSMYFIHDLFGTLPSDFTFKGYNEFITMKTSEAPLTNSEREKKENLESGEIYTGGTSSYVHGVSFAIESKLDDAVKQFVNGSINYVRIAIDTKNEKTILDSTGKIELAAIKKEINSSEPRFHLYAWKHDHEGSTLTSYIFFYSCPDGTSGSQNAPIKMKMLYSSCKASVEAILTNLGKEFAAKFELSGPEDFDPENIKNTIHPPPRSLTSQFAKPQKPGKGARSLHK